MTKGEGPHRTVFRPSPLQGMGEAQPPPPPPVGAFADRSRDDVPAPPVAVDHRNPMMAQAAPLLALGAGVRSGRARVDLPSLHRQASAAIVAFDAAMAGRYPPDQVKRARYALCATIDDIALNLPGHSNDDDAAEWARRALSVRFFGENVVGDRFWTVLDEMVARPAEYADVLELYHACLAAGFEGRYRVVDGGRQQSQAVMQRAFQALPHVGRTPSGELSPRWRGVDAPARANGVWGPIALVAAVAGVALLLIYIVLSLMLAQSGREATRALNALYPEKPVGLSRSAAPPPAPDGAQVGRLRAFLAREIAAGLVQVEEDPQTIRVRTTDGEMFRSGQDVLVPARRALVERIAQAIETEPGPVRVEGYTDSDPSRSLAFPSNTALAEARARTVADLIAARLSDPSRVSAEGYGEARPVAANTSPDGKALNRRVEVVIERRGN